MARRPKTYRMPHRRRRERKTNYRLRLRLLKSGKLRFVVRKSNNNITCQLVEYSADGDKIMASASSRDLRNFGWNAHGGSLPSAYLVGMLCGLKAKGREAVLDIGLQGSTKGSGIYAAVKGALDAGLKIPCSKNILPDDKRVRGEHIVQFALKLKKENPEEYRKRFSNYLKIKLNPEDLVSHFKDVVGKIKK